MSVHISNISKIKICPSCDFTVTNYLINNHKRGQPYSKSPRKRAGVCIYNPFENKILVVQVFNEFLGLPKGGQEEGETTMQTALRELNEETGITLPLLDENSKVIFDRTCTYYIIQTDICFTPSLNKFEGNDVSGVGWVHLDCISKINGKITSHLDRMVKYINKLNSTN